MRLPARVLTRVPVALPPQLEASPIQLAGLITGAGAALAAGVSASVVAGMVVGTGASTAGAGMAAGTSAGVGAGAIACAGASVAAGVAKSAILWKLEIFLIPGCSWSAPLRSPNPSYPTLPALL